MRNLMLAEVVQVSGGNTTILTVNVKAHVSTVDLPFVAEQLSNLVAKESQDPVSIFEALKNHPWAADSKITFLSTLAPCAFTISYL